LLLAVLSTYSLEYFRFNLEQAVEFICSFHALFIAGAGFILLSRRLTDHWYGPVVFLLSFLYNMIFYGRSLSFTSMEGDNICQIAYWNILFNPHLAGSIGSSQTKPGQVLVSGLIYEMGQAFGDFYMQIGLCLVMAAGAWCLIMIATDIGGRVAGVILFPLVTSYLFLYEFIKGSYSIYLTPVLFTGLWLYFYREEHRSLGRLLLVLSLQFHLQIITVLAMIIVWHFLRKAWTELLLFTLWGGFSLSVWAWAIHRIQGALDRAANGSAVGYLTYGPPYSPHITMDKVFYIIEVVRNEISHYLPLRVLFVLMFIAVLGACYYGRRHYLVVFSTLILLIAYVLLVNGPFNLGRFWAILYAFAGALGIGSIVRYVRENCRTSGKPQILLTGLALVLLTLTADASMLNVHKDVAYEAANHLNTNSNYASGSKLLTDSYLTYAARILTEDAYLYSIVYRSPEKYRSLAALQHFNVAPEEIRRQILGRTDYVVIAINALHDGYYLRNLTLPAWRQDPFRQMVRAFIAGAGEGTLYGKRFTLVDMDTERLILKVEPLPAGS
jgi:hypothetical protein